ncbi:MAG: flagellar assembly protein FliH, partial [Treponema sp.]|nr:flagellar assembly protein FliH [Treponema sp.]
MAKAVFRPVEVALTGSRVVLDPPHAFPGMAHLAPVEDSGEAPEEAAVEEYTGPTAEDLRREAEAFKVQWEREREALIGSA